MTMSDVKLVKVDNWGIYFLQRLKHFFNRTDYCDLTLQFQDNAQLKVHRLVLSACTEYFEVLERTCEMYEDCLVMPDDLQADVVVPIVNFMYTGQLEFRMDLLDRLIQTSEIMNMPVLTKLLNSHRPRQQIPKPPKPIHSYPIKHAVNKEKEVLSTPITSKRSYTKAFSAEKLIKDNKKHYETVKKAVPVTNKTAVFKPPSPIFLDCKSNKKNTILGDPRPTRYELPEELDMDNVFENSFSTISYASQPLMVHPETQKKYAKKPRLVGETSTKKLGASTMDIVECKKISSEHVENIFEDSFTDRMGMENDMFPTFVKTEPTKDPSKLFDQILDQNEEVAKVTIETAKAKKANVAANLDHAKIISEVLKKYPHLVRSNKNIKLKILNPPSKNVQTKKTKVTQSVPEKQGLKTEPLDSDFTYEADVLDSKQAARLIALGAENIDGPWICLICGTPGRALQFTSYYKYRRHLVEVHKEKPVLTICEYCGQRLTKRNYLLHHMYTRHGIEPPPQYHFPKCNYCDYIAISEALLAKHKLSHGEGRNYRNYLAFTEALAKAKSEQKSHHCYVCSASFKNETQLFAHIQATDHRVKKGNLQCIYCMKVFFREPNLYAHLKTNHKAEVVRDGLLDDSDEESQPQHEKTKEVKHEISANDYEEVDIQYQIQQGPDGIHVVTKKSKETSPQKSKQKILNSGFEIPVEVEKQKPTPRHNEFVQEINITTESDCPNEVIMIDNTEYIMKGNKLVHKPKQNSEFILPDMVTLNSNQMSQNITVPVEYTSISNSAPLQANMQGNSINTSMAEPISIYVSNEEEYKALMSANHPIIFDADDANKSLTVLTAPHSETLQSSTIDLENAQSNEMMVIQEGFPINVTEAVSSENQNFVVVYSHQVDQNKEYQLLSTQALETQYAQSSTIITQNYETVTTTTPVINAHVLGTQINANWQGNMQNVTDITVEQPSETIVQQSLGCTEVEMASGVEDNAEMSELPQVDMGQINNETPQMSMENIPNHEVDIQSNGQAVEPAEEVITAIPTQNISSMSVDEHLPSEEIVEETVNSESQYMPSESNYENNDEPVVSEPLLQTEADEVNQQVDSSQNEEIASIESQTYTQEEEIIDGGLSETLVSNEAVACDSMNDEVQSEIQESIHDPATENDNTDAVEQNKSVVEEWSEGESETTSQDIPVDAPNAELRQADPEIEESIENIQREVDKHISEVQPQCTNDDNITAETEQENDNITAETEQENDNITAETVEENDNITAETVEENDSLEEETELDESNVEPDVEHNPGTETVVAKPTVKITSLLNDWDDNDSQDEAESTNENGAEEQNETAPITDTVTETAAEIAPDMTQDTEESQNPVKDPTVVVPQENIKSLVSDWDEEDEENK